MIVPPASTKSVSVQIIPAVGSTLQCGQHQFQVPRLPGVIRVKECDEGTGRPIQARIPSAGHAAIGLVAIDDPRIACERGGDEVGGVVRGPIVDHEHLEIRDALGEDTGDRFQDRRSAVIRGDDDADHR